jgi:sulfite reductase (NADPH) flavoprotein alpha-component
VNAVVVPEFLPTLLNAEKSALLTRLVEGLQPAELYWVAAWIATQAQSQGGTQVAEPVPAKAIGERLTIVYGSQTGNAKRIAEQLAERSEAAGLPVRLVRANAYPQRELAQER